MTELFMLKGLLTNPTAPHLTEAVFRRYESVLADFLTTYPSAFSVTPAGFAPTTFIAQLRNAANAHIANRFESSVDPDALALAWKSSIATINDGKVLVGPKAGVREALRAEYTTDEVQPQFLCEIPEPTLDQLNALALLYATGVFHLPSKIGAIPIGYIPYPNTSLATHNDAFILL